MALPRWQFAHGCVSQLPHRESFYLRHRERNNSLYFFNLISWSRYVDDALCVYDGSESALSLLLHTLNSYHFHVLFTLVVGSNHVLKEVDEGSKFLGKSVEFLAVKLAILCSMRPILYGIQEDIAYYVVSAGQVYVVWLSYLRRYLVEVGKMRRVIK